MPNIKPTSQKQVSFENPVVYLPTPEHGIPPNAPAPLAWRQVPVRRGKTRAVRIIWNPRFLKTALDGNPALTFRSPNNKSTKPTVLADMLVMGDETVSIEGQILRSVKKAKNYTLRMRLLVPIPAHTRAQVTLRWGAQTYTTAFHNGAAEIQDLPPVTKAQAQTDEPIPNFSLTLDFDGAPPAPHDA